MSQENLDFVGRFYLPVAEGGYQSSDTASALKQIERVIDEDMIDPALEWSPFIVGLTEGHGYIGHDGLRQWARDMFDAWESFEIRATGVRELSSADVLVNVRISARGRASGILLQREVAHLWTFRDHRLRRFRSFQHEKEALEAAGVGA